MKRPYLGIVVGVLTLGCDLVHPSDPVALDRDVVLVETVLFAGSDEIHAVVGFPHRNGGASPALSLSIDGPSASTPLQPASAPSRCGLLSPKAWGVYQCLRAGLGAPLASGERFRLRGAGPAGEIVGETTIPRAPTLAAPASDTVVARTTANGELASIRLTFASPPEVDLVELAIHDLTVRLANGEERDDCTLITNPASGAPLPREGTVELAFRFLSCPGGATGWREFRVSAQVVGYDGAYGRFVRSAGAGILRQPAPDFGLRGAVGVFGSAAASRRVQVTVQQ